MLLLIKKCFYLLLNVPRTFHAVNIVKMPALMEVVC